MQSAGQRTLSTLASKLHPPLTLTPHESRQLLQLLTQSFRTHLDREHPVGPYKRRIEPLAHSLQKQKDNVSSSHGLTADHLDSILANPLLSHQPHRPGTNPAVAEILRDPLGWFLDHVALGTATVHKLMICVPLLKRELRRGDAHSTHPNRKRAATLIAEWLRTSELENSREFVEQMISHKHGKNMLLPIVPLLLAEDNQAPLWRWLTWPTAQRVKETGLNVAQVTQFKQQLFKAMVGSAPNNIEYGMALAIFLRAYGMAQSGGAGISREILVQPGAMIVNRIMEGPHLVTADRCAPELYDSFLLSSSDWLHSWSKAVQAMLHLHHPTEPSAQPGLDFIKDPTGAKVFVNGSNSKRRFLVRLCLGVARQLIAKDQLADAQVAMDFAQEHFADIVSSRTEKTRPTTSVEDEQRNLAMLDRLLLT